MDSSGVMGHSGDGNPEYIAERTAVSAIAGGTASVLSRRQVRQRRNYGCVRAAV